MKIKLHIGGAVRLKPGCRRHANDDIIIANRGTSVGPAVKLSAVDATVVQVYTPAMPRCVALLHLPIGGALQSGLRQIASTDRALPF